jgi:carbamoyltransferase
VNIPPAPSDAGLALGAAAFVAWRSGQEIQVHSPFLNGDDPAPDQDSTSESVPLLRSTEAVAEAIADGAIVGVWTGKAEVGPRALGHRSLLARPDSVPLRRRLSEDIKRREWYRPVAPMMLPEVAQESLTGYRGPSALSRYMFGAWPIAPDMAPAFEGCIHADRTVRAQVVEPDLSDLGHIRELLLLLRDR